MGRALVVKVSESEGRISHGSRLRSSEALMCQNDTDHLIEVALQVVRAASGSVRGPFNRRLVLVLRSGARRGISKPWGA